MTITNIKFTNPTVGNTSDTSGYVKGGTTVKGQEALLVADMSTRSLLGGILLELKKLNLRQEAAFEEQVNDGDIPCE